jgi:N-acetylmuramoyl-L-alanine amidase
LTNQRAPKVFIPLLASLLVFPALSFSATLRSRRAQAIDAFNRAEALREKLSSKPEKDQKVSDYRVLILAYHSVYRLDPGYGKAPVALEDIAEIYREMGRRFSQASYFKESIEAYRFLMKEYPDASLSHDGPLNIADVYLTDLHQPEEARKEIEGFLDKYPRSDKADDARARLEVIQQTMESKRPPALPPAPPTTVTSVGADTEAAAGGVPQVTEIRHWVGPHYTRIVIGLAGGEVKFETQRVSNPDRIVLDLLNSHLSKALAGKKFPVEDGFLRQVRVGQYKPDVTRVVLDVEKVQDYFVFPLPNPFRLVVDIHGPQPEAAPMPEVAKSTPSKENQTTQNSELAANAEPPAVAATRKSAGTVKAPKEIAAARTDERRGKVSAPLAESAPIKAAGPTETGSRTLTRALGLKIGKIVIDPGHGGHDTGTIGPTGLEEKDVVLDVALRLAKILREQASSDVILTRSTDVFIPLEERTAIANEKGADLFISIHANSSRDRSARGIETYYLNFTSDPGALEVAARENATSQESVHELRDLIQKIALTEKVEESHEFAMQLQRAVFGRLEKATGSQKNRGVKKAPFVVLIGANMPSILAEISFLSNPRDERLLKRPEYRQKIAEALARGVLDYAQNLGGIKVAQRVTSVGHP